MESVQVVTWREGRHVRQLEVLHIARNDERRPVWLQLVFPQAFAVAERRNIEAAKAPRAGLASLAGGDAYGEGQGASRGRADTRQGVRQRTDPRAKACSRHYAL